MYSVSLGVSFVVGAGVSHMCTCSVSSPSDCWSIALWCVVVICPRSVFLLFLMFLRCLVIVFRPCGVCMFVCFVLMCLCVCGISSGGLVLYLLLYFFSYLLPHGVGYLFFLVLFLLWMGPVIAAYGFVFPLYVAV